MQPSKSPATALGALLFVRSADDVGATLQVANRFLWRRRAGHAPEGDVFGMVIGTRADGALHEPAEGTRVGLSEAVGISSVWSLCWFELSGMIERRTPAAIRRYLLDRLQSDGDRGASSPDRARVSFLPVLTPTEARDDISALFAGLQARYPSLGLLRTLVVDDPLRGGVVNVTGNAPLAAPSMRLDSRMKA
jgi:hypothetical protein